MAIDAHIKFDGVDGEATHQDHKGEVEILSFSHGVSNSRSISGGGSGTGKAVPNDFTITHNYDKASPTLMKKCAEGTHIPKAVLTVRKAGEGQKDFMTITMSSVFITSVTPGGSAGGDLLEHVSMSYDEIAYSYKPQDEKGGLGGEVKFSWNVKTTKIT